MPALLSAPYSSFTIPGVSTTDLRLETFSHASFYLIDDDNVNVTLTRAGGSDPDTKFQYTLARGHLICVRINGDMVGGIEYHSIMDVLMHFAYTVTVAYDKREPAATRDDGVSYRHARYVVITAQRDHRAQVVEDYKLMLECVNHEIQYGE
jgi:hypothetical protein